MPEEKPGKTFSHLVVVGASAGGIEAISEVAATLPADFPAPVVIAQHLDPRHESNLQSIVGRRSALPVRTVEDHESLEAGVVYVVPSDYHVNISDHEIGLQADSAGRPKPSVDLLMSSAAEIYGEYLIAVVLTGTGTDGTDGARVVKKMGGTVIVQDPETARFGGMPSSLAPSTVDAVVPLTEIGPMVASIVASTAVPDEGLPGDEEELRGFLEDLRELYGMDFTSYKPPTLMRRLRRRMAATGQDEIEAYAGYLKKHPEEQRQLINAFLIKVTEFFRNPELYEYLREEVVPGLIAESRERGTQLRIWSAGCATGEEAYSLAILLHEALGGESAHFDARIFATDVDEEAVAFARQGIYPASALGGLSEEQVEKYFIRRDGGQYEVRKPVRSMIVFGEHDLGRRSPFPNIDLTVSRNVLIYFTSELQKRALRLFAYSLRDGGYLVLGKAETVGPAEEFFEPLHRQYKVYRRVGERFLMPPSPGSMGAPTRKRPLAPHATGPRGAVEKRRQDAREAYDTSLSRMPVGVVVVDRRYDIQAINAQARRLLSIHGVAVGDDLLHLMNNVPYGEVRAAIDSALRDGERVRTRTFSLQEPATGQPRHLRLDCYPVHRDGEDGLAEATMILVQDVSEEEEAKRELDEQLRAARADLERFRAEVETERAHQEAQNRRLVDTNRQIEEANRELALVNEEVQVAYEDALVQSEEAQAATEEVETLNEELQATNEELETLNEELQATIEELNTTNDDLQARSAELQELARSYGEEQGRLRTILENIPDAVLVVNAAGRTVMTNAAYGRLFGERDFDALDDLGEDMAPGDTPQQQIARGETFEADFQAEVQDGSLRRLRAKGRPIGDGSSGGVILVHTLPRKTG